MELAFQWLSYFPVYSQHKSQVWIFRFPVQEIIDIFKDKDTHDTIRPPHLLCGFAYRHGDGAKVPWTVFLVVWYGQINRDRTGNYVALISRSLSSPSLLMSTFDIFRNVLLHFADISNSMKPFSIARFSPYVRCYMYCYMVIASAVAICCHDSRPYQGVWADLVLEESLGGMESRSKWEQLWTSFF